MSSFADQLNHYPYQNYACTNNDCCYGPSADDRNLKNTYDVVLYDSAWMAGVDYEGEHESDETYIAGEKDEDKEETDDGNDVDGETDDDNDLDDGDDDDDGTANNAGVQ